MGAYIFGARGDKTARYILLFSAYRLTGFLTDRSQMLLANVGDAFEMFLFFHF